MNAQNLRVGNYVKAKGLVCEIISIAKDQVECLCLRNSKNEFASLSMNDVEPIPLDQSVLAECCGFNNENRLGVKNMFLQYTPKNDTYIILENDKHESLIHFWDVKSLHQLQNLYFALAGTELAIALSCLAKMMS